MKRIFERITDYIVFYGYDKPLGTVVTKTGWIRHLVTLVFGGLVTQGFLEGKVENYETWISGGVLGLNFLLESYVRYLSTVKIEMVQQRLGMDNVDGWFWKQTANALQDKIESTATADVKQELTSVVLPATLPDPMNAKGEPSPTENVAVEREKTVKKASKRPKKLGPKSKPTKGKVKVPKRS